MSDKTYFLGWTNIKWVLRELNKMGSESEKSFYSYKRFQTFASFRVFIVCWPIILFDLMKKGAGMSEYLMWASPLLLIAGYTLKLTEIAKKESKENGITDKQ